LAEQWHFALRTRQIWDVSENFLVRADKHSGRTDERIFRSWSMIKQSQAKNIIEVKTALAEKYERLARDRNSKPAKARLLRHANRFRAQANTAAKSASK